MVGNVCIVVSHNTKGPRMCTKLHHLIKLKLIPPAGSLHFLVIDILGALSRTHVCSWVDVIMTDKYMKLTRAIQITMIASSQVSNIVLNNLIIFYRIPDTVLFDNGQQFVSKCSAFLRSYLGTTKLETTGFHQQTDAWVEKHNKTLFMLLQIKTVDNRKNCSISV